MVRVSTLKKNIHSNLDSNLRRVYPILKGPEIWGDLREKRKEFHQLEGRFPLVNEPLIEAIPQYEPGTNSTPKELAADASQDLNKKRLKRLAEYLEIAGDKWPLYPHQKESLEGYLDGNDVVVATGTGSGKTEAFLFPMFSHLDAEAIRCEEDGEESQRALKAIILYPMNALVADQMKRIRKYLGNPEIAAKYMNNGYGRFPQFGMYTGRTDYHGWYEISKSDVTPSKTQRRMRDLISNYNDLESREDAWGALQDLGKIPSIGGELELNDDGYLTYDQLSTRGKKDVRSLIDPSTGTKLNKKAENKKYILKSNSQIFERFNSRDLKPNLKSEVPGGHVKWMGDGLDRELVIRHQMHHGGLRKHLMDNNFPSEYHEDILNSTGIPDVLVTNYSMLEYMLMRPLEHTFWDSTGKWLRNCKRTNNDNLRRKLLLIVDEAHLYQGAMGTEFSLLLNRILSALGDDIEREQIHFIITSASLGEKEENKITYAKDLLSLSQHRAKKLVIPESKIVKIKGGNEQNFYSKNELNKFLETWEKISEGRILRHECELQLLISLFGKKVDDTYNHYLKEGFDNHIAYESTCYDFVKNSWWGVRLMRLLLQPSELSQSDKNMVNQYYKNENLNREVQKPLDRIPRRFSLIQEFMFNERNDDTSKATEILLDLIASARPHTKKGPGKPLLPVRAHLFVRGNTVNRICCNCGTFYEDGVLTCSKCDARNYTLYFDRNCGGVYVKLWLEVSSNNFRYTWNQNSGYPRPQDIGEAKRAHQSREISYSGRQISDKLLGVLARILDPDDISITHWMDPYSGVLSKTERSGFLPLQISGYHENNFNFSYYSSKSLTPRKWEAKGGFVEPRICDYCKGDYTRKHRSSQFSDTETRGEEYFTGIITEALSIQDIDPKSKTPHKGKKMLVFSDGRQRAARLAAGLSETMAIDEGRALFTYLHRRPWFSSLSEDRRHLDRIYPYMCLLSGKFGLNYLTDSENEPEKTRMLIHTSSLTSWILLNYDSNNEKYNSLKTSLLEDQDLEDIAEKQMRIQIKNCVDWAIKDNRIYDGEDVKDSEKEEKEHNTTLLEEFKTTYFSSTQEYDGFSIFDDWNNDKEIKKIMGKYRFKLKKLRNNQILCKCFGIRDIFLNDTNHGHIEISKIISKAVINDLENKVITSETIDDLFEEWLTEILPNDIAYDKVPRQFGTLIIKWIIDRNFGLMETGLGSIRLIVSHDDREKMGNKSELFRDIIPQILRSYKPLEDPEIMKTNNQSYTSEGQMSSEKSTGCFVKDSHWNAFGYSTPKSATTDDEIKLEEMIEAWTDHVFDEDEFEYSIKEYFSIGDRQASLRDRRPWSVKANKLIFEPWEGGIEDDINFCKDCFTPKYNMKIKCINCSNDDSKNLNDIEYKNYFDERLKHWRKRVIELESHNSEISTLQIFRAEEHTAQIGQKIDNDMLFSGTELHELMFQDIPLKGRNLGIDTKIEQPPIDILSCTTTMEVGIDIGNLTAVALRTVPPHAANYQQRVGRAGRGKSEVSLALTWVDNSAYAQAHFNVPERLVKHPEEAPNLYLDNEKIKKRHFNAICFQRYFKRKKYDSESLTFEDMAPSMGSSNLLESLGTSKSFFLGNNASYSSENMINWLENLNEYKKNKIMQSTRTNNELFDKWKEDLIEWLEFTTDQFQSKGDV